MKRKEHPWYLLTGSILGVILGILISWVFLPVVYIDTLPSSLRADYKDQYRFMIAAGFAANHDLTRASARLNTISDQDPLTMLNQQILSMKESKYPVEQIQFLEDLEYAIQSQPTSTPAASITSTNTITSTTTVTNTVIPSSTNTPTEKPSLTPTLTPLPSSTSQPTQIETIISSSTTIIQKTPTQTQTQKPTVTKTLTKTPLPSNTIEILPSQTLKPIATLPLKINKTSTPTPEKIFVLTKKTGACDQANPGLLQIYLKNSNSAPAPGVEIVISWNSGEDHFFTGLKPELGYGYADFKMADNIEYTLSISRGNTRVTNLKTSTCSGSQGGKYLSGLLLEFKQP